MISYRLKTLLALALGGTIAALSCRTHYPVITERFSATKRAESRERGRNLTFNICGGCHYDPATNKFSGKFLKGVPKIAGKVYSANLTQSKSFGVPPDYSDAELTYLIKTGINREGRFIPYMLRPNIGDDDINDIIVFLRSDDPSVAPVDRSAGSTHLTAIGKLGVRLVAHPQPYRKGIRIPPEENPAAYGRYLVDIIGCYHCHSKKPTSVNYLDPEKTKGYMAGGAKSGKVRGANLTFDKETGIGKYSQEQFREAVQHATDRNGKKLRPPMQAFPLTDKQADAIYAYLQTLPPRHHRIKGR